MIPRRWLARLALPLFTLLFVCGASGGGLYWLSLERERVLARAGEARGDVRDLRREIADLEQRAAYMAAFRETYDEIRGHGVLKPQKRLEAGDTLERLAVERDLLRARYTFEKARRMPLLGDASDGEAADVLVGTRVRLTLETRGEAEVFAFVNAVQASLPGYVMVRSVQLTRAPDDIGKALDEIRRGGQPTLVRAVVNLHWVTLSLAPVDEGAANAGGAPDA
jgi:hypothetical protein